MIHLRIELPQRLYLNWRANVGHSTNTLVRIEGASRSARSQTRPVPAPSLACWMKSPHQKGMQHAKLIIQAGNMEGNHELLELADAGPRQVRDVDDNLILFGVEVEEGRTGLLLFFMFMFIFTNRSIGRPRLIVIGCITF